MFDDKQRDALSHNDAFIAFLREVHELRETAIQQLHDRPVDSVQQLAGRILQCDDILSLGGWSAIENRKRD